MAVCLDVIQIKNVFHVAGGKLPASQDSSENACVHYCKRNGNIFVGTLDFDHR